MAALMLPLPAKAPTEEKTNTCKDQCLMTHAYGLMDSSANHD